MPKILSINSSFVPKGGIISSFRRKKVKTYPHAHALSLFQFAIDNEFNIPISMSQQVELLNIVSVIPDQQRFSSARFVNSLNAAINEGRDLNELLDEFFSKADPSESTEKGVIANAGNSKKFSSIKEEIRTSVLKTLSSRLSSNIFKAIDGEALNSVYTSECHLGETVMMIRTLFDLSAAFRSSQAGGELKSAIDKVYAAQESGEGKVQSHIRALLNYFKNDTTPTVPGSGLHFLKYLDTNNNDVFNGDKWAEHELSVKPLKLSFESVMQSLDYILLGVRLHGKDPYGSSGGAAVSLESLLSKDIEVLDLSALLRPIDFSGSGDFSQVKENMNTEELNRFIRISYKKWLLKMFKDGFPMSDMRPAYVKEDDHSLIAQISMAYAESRATADLLSTIVSDLLEYAMEFKKLTSPSDESTFLHPDVIESFMNRLKHMTDTSAETFLDNLFVRFDKLIAYNPVQLSQNGITLSFASSGNMRVALPLYEHACHIGLCKLDSDEDKWHYDVEFLNRWQARKLSVPNFFPAVGTSPDLIEWPPYNWPLEADPIDDLSLKAVMTTEHEYGLYPLLGKFASIFTCDVYSPGIQGLRHVSKVIFDTLANAKSIRLVTLTRKKDLYNYLGLPETEAVATIVNAMFKKENAFPAIVGLSDNSVVTRMLSLEDTPSLDSEYSLLNEVGRSLYPDNLVIANVYALNIIKLDNKLIPTGGKKGEKPESGKKKNFGKGKGKGKEKEEEKEEEEEVK